MSAVGCNHVHVPHDSDAGSVAAPETDEFGLSQEGALWAAAIGFVLGFAAAAVSLALDHALPKTLPELLEVALPVGAPIIFVAALIDSLLTAKSGKLEKDAAEALRQRRAYGKLRRFIKALWQVFPLAAGVGYMVVALDPVRLEIGRIFLVAVLAALLGITGYLVPTKRWQIGSWVVAAILFFVAFYLFITVTPGQDQQAYQCQYVTDSQGARTNEVSCEPIDSQDELSDKALQACMNYAQEIEAEHLVRCLVGP